MAFCSFVTLMLLCACVRVSLCRQLYFGVFCSFDIRVHNRKACANPPMPVCLLNRPIHTHTRTLTRVKWYIRVDSISQRPIILLTMPRNQPGFALCLSCVLPSTTPVSVQSNELHYGENYNKCDKYTCAWWRVHISVDAICNLFVWLVIVIVIVFLVVVCTISGK